MKWLAVSFANIMFAKFVKGPFVNMVIFDPGFSELTTEFQISRANGCLSSG